jgi:hypothetical protein
MTSNKAITHSFYARQCASSRSITKVQGRNSPLQYSSCMLRLASQEKKGGGSNHCRFMLKCYCLLFLLQPATPDELGRICDTFDEKLLMSGPSMLGTVHFTVYLSLLTISQYTAIVVLVLLHYYKWVYFFQNAKKLQTYNRMNGSVIISFYSTF